MPTPSSTKWRVITPALVEYLDAVEGQMSEKVDNIVRFVRNLEVSSEAIGSEIERLQKASGKLQKQS
ncbi:MAG: siphovirus Gp157 family protein [Candidatus Moraniibacteriota bacterium]